MSNRGFRCMTKAFSLIELMVVVAIIGLLATIAVPAYTNYTNKSKVGLAALVLNDFNTKAIALYNEGLITPGITSLTLDGVEYPDNTPVAVNYPPVIGVSFFAPADGFVNANAWMFCAYVAGLSFPGYVEGIGGSYSRLCSKVVVNNGIFTTYCGRWDDGNNLEIPLGYLPSKCDEPFVISH